MRINLYTTEQNEDGLITLVKEQGINYPEDRLDNPKKNNRDVKLCV